MNTAAQTPTQTPTPNIGPTMSSIDSRALSLLGSGIAPSTVAASLGLSNARISQLLSEESFAAQVAELRYQNLAKHNERDGKADAIEDRLLDRIEEGIDLVHRPMELAKLYQIVNNAKRRGSSTPEALVEKQSVIQLVIPIQIVNKFSTNIQGQVTTVGSGSDEQNLLTIQSGALDSLVKESKNGTSRAETGRVAIEHENSTDAGRGRSG